MHAVFRRQVQVRSRHCRVHELYHRHYCSLCGGDGVCRPYLHYHADADHDHAEAYHHHAHRNHDHVEADHHHTGPMLLPTQALRLRV